MVLSVLMTKEWFYLYRRNGLSVPRNGFVCTEGRVLSAPRNGYICTEGMVLQGLECFSAWLSIPNSSKKQGGANPVSILFPAISHSPGTAFNRQREREKEGQRRQTECCLLISLQSATLLELSLADREKGRKKGKRRTTECCLLISLLSSTLLELSALLADRDEERKREREDKLSAVYLFPCYQPLSWNCLLSQQTEILVKRKREVNLSIAIFLQSATLLQYTVLSACPLADRQKGRKREREDKLNAVSLLPCNHPFFMHLCIHNICEFAPNTFVLYSTCRPQRTVPLYWRGDVKRGNNSQLSTTSTLVHCEGLRIVVGFSSW